MSQVPLGMESKEYSFFFYFDVQFINLYLVISISLNILMLLIQPINQKLMNLANYISPNI